MLKRLAMFLAICLCVSCVHKYAVPDPPTRPILRNATLICLVTPQNGRDDRGSVYASSGEWTRAALEGSLVQKGFEVVSAPPAESLESALSAASERDAVFLVYPTIEHWADHLTEWSGIPDRITIRMQVAEISSGRMLDDRRVRASSRWFTLGGDHPQELLPELASRWVETVAP